LSLNRLENVRRTDSYSSHGDKHLNEADIASMLKNLDHDSSTLRTGSEVLEHTKPEKSEIIEGNVGDLKMFLVITYVSVILV
jgi:hypothetical protein